MFKTQALLPHPHVPTEVIHEIIDNLPSSDPSFVSTQSNVALVSHCCRHRINFRRFSKLEIYVHAMPIEDLKALEGILGSDIWQQQEGVVQHFRSISLLLGQKSYVTPPYDRSRDNTTSKILKNFLKGSGNNPFDRPSYSLSICTYDRFSHYYHKNGPYSITGLDFDTLGSETISILHDLFRNRHPATLHLECMWNIPSNIFSASSILNLCINHCHFVMMESPENSTLLPNLLYLEVKEAPSFVPVCYDPLNQHIQTIDLVRFWLRSEEEYLGLFMIGNYATTLEIVLHGSKISSVPFN